MEFFYSRTFAIRLWLLAFFAFGITAQPSAALAPLPPAALILAVIGTVVLLVQALRRDTSRFFILVPSLAGRP